jgi:predicted TIM-barrel fold metal-dependent hydrolase
VNGPRQPELTFVTHLAGWNPEPKLVTNVTEIRGASQPVIDCHNHLGRWLTGGGEWMCPSVPALLETMRSVGVHHVVNLDGIVSRDLEDNLRRYDHAHPESFSTFMQLDWSALASRNPSRDLANQVRQGAQLGAVGIKIWKDVGLEVKRADGQRLMVDDEILTPVWETAAELDLPVCVHVADPMAFFDPIDLANERLEELTVHPEWWFGDRARYPEHRELIDRLDVLVGTNPSTKFMAAHLASCAEDLNQVDRLLSSHSNLYVDIGSRLAEIGRQPRRFAELVAAHPRRVVFGIDRYPANSDHYCSYFRFLETLDEHFPYWSAGELPTQGRWRVSGCGLPGELLRGLYAENARSFLGVRMAERLQLNVA